MNSLLLTVRLHDSRYHGVGDWPPAPARLFQALLAGAARGASVSGAARATLTWLEALPPPTIVTPFSRRGQRLMSYVPNNDIDAVDGDPRRVDKIRVGKTVEPLLLDGPPVFLYAWPLEEGRDSHLEELNSVAHQLYQFGRGIDMACAQAEQLGQDDVTSRLSACDGVIYRPTGGNGGVHLECPTEGSLQSLEQQYLDNRHRLSVLLQGRQAKVIFRRAPKPRFVSVSYAAPPTQLLFELRTDVRNAPYARVSLHRAGELTASLRDKAIERLSRALPSDRGATVERTLRNRDAPVSDAPRARILPLASVGHAHVDRAIRRILVEVPSNCPVSDGDIAWAFSGLVVKDQIDVETGEVLAETRLVASDSARFLSHYGIEADGRGHARWRTVTPAALPVIAARRRIDSRHRQEQAKAGAEFAREHTAARRAVMDALRHAQLDAKVVRLAVQREPFEARGTHAEAFAPGTRFDKARLWHVDLEFERLVTGPIVIGDGRYTGLGVMAPVRHPVHSPALHVLSIARGAQPNTDPRALTRALRRAVMFRVQSTLGARRPLPRWFTGHEANGEPSQHDHAHLFFQADLSRKRLLVIGPHLLNHTPLSSEDQRYLATLENALQGFDRLNAGPAGGLSLHRTLVDPTHDPLLRPSRTWLNVTPYVPTRYPKKAPLAEAVAADLTAELRRKNFPRGDVEVIKVHEGRRGGVSAQVRLVFGVPVAGPIALGRTSHLGGGLFACATER